MSADRRLLAQITVMAAAKAYADLHGEGASQEAAEIREALKIVCPFHGDDHDHDDPNYEGSESYAERFAEQDDVTP